MVEHHGWHVASTFGDPAMEAARTRESVGLADLSWTSKWLLQGPGMNSAPSLPPEATAWLLGRRQYLLTCEPPAADGVIKHFRHVHTSATVSSPTVLMTDVTSVYAQLLLAGPRCREVLGKLTSLNLSEGARANLSCAQAGVAHVHAIVLRQDLARIPAFHLLVGREYGESVWEAVLHAGQEFHITPFGLAAQRSLQG